MDKTVKKLIATHIATAHMYRQLAEEACERRDTFGVFDHIKSSIAEEHKARRLEMRYASREVPVV